MKALAIDSASSCMVVAAKNGENTVTLSLDIGMKQSEKILPAIQYVLAQANIAVCDLDYMAVTKGPGTFTGLRLAFSALKAISLAHNVPIYGVSSLEAYAQPYAAFPYKVVGAVDAKSSKEQWFVAVYQNGTCLLEAQDANVATVLSCLHERETVFVAGHAAEAFAAALTQANDTLTVICSGTQPPATQALFTLAEAAIAKKMPPLQEYEGPAYLRKSEAELSLERQQ